MGATLLEGFGVVRSNTAKMLSLVRLGWNSVGSTDTSTAGLRMSFERTFVCPSNYGTDDLLVHARNIADAVETQNLPVARIFCKYVKPC